MGRYRQQRAMAQESQQARAFQAIGAYFCALSALERELGETIKVIFRLQQREAADTIVAVLGGVAKKIRLVRSAAQIAKNADGSQTSGRLEKQGRRHDESDLRMR